jgi:hypothetical protein
VVNRKYSLVIELRDDNEENSLQAIGLTLNLANMQGMICQKIFISSGPVSSQSYNNY